MLSKRFRPREPVVHRAMQIYTYKQETWVQKEMERKRNRNLNANHNSGYGNVENIQNKSPFLCQATK